MDLDLIDDIGVVEVMDGGKVQTYNRRPGPDGFPAWFTKAGDSVPRSQILAWNDEGLVGMVGTLKSPLRPLAVQPQRPRPDTELRGSILPERKSKPTAKARALANTPAPPARRPTKPDPSLSPPWEGTEDFPRGGVLVAHRATLVKLSYRNGARPKAKKAKPRNRPRPPARRHEGPSLGAAELIERSRAEGRTPEQIADALRVKRSDRPAFYRAFLGDFPPRKEEPMPWPPPEHITARMLAAMELEIAHG